MDEESFEEGYRFAMLLSGIEKQIEPQVEFRNLEQLSNGDISLIPSDADAIAKYEHMHGAKISEEEREMVRRLLDGRKEREEEHKRYAQIILKRRFTIE
jgi:hypothetical protein